jgi:predicted SAM-dependent methyltransferase
MMPPVLEDRKVATTVAADCLRAGGVIRLNLGGAGEGYRDGKIPGFLTVDLREGEGTDIVADASDLSIIPDGRCEAVYASNILEHFPHTQTVAVLKEWRRVLVPGGKAYISVPDFDATVKLYLKEGLVDWVKYLAWGDQAGPLNYHYINFTFASLALEVNRAGFSDVKRVVSFAFGVNDASEIRDNRYKIRVSLNVECVK